MKGKLARTQYKKTRLSIMKLQALIRAMLARRSYKRLRRSECSQQQLV